MLRLTIIDHDPAVAHSVKQALPDARRFSCAFVSCQEAEGNLAKIATTHTPDVVLTSAFPVANRWKLDRHARSIPIWLYAGAAEQELVAAHRRLKFACDEYLNFPFVPEQLAQALERLLHPRRRRVALS